MTLRCSTLTAALLVYCSVAVLAGELADLTVVAVPQKGVEYRYEWTGVCGTVDDDGIRVTRVLPGSPSDGIVQVGDLIERAEHRNFVGALSSGTFKALAHKAIYRTRNDHWRHLRLYVRRPGVDGGAPLTLRVHLVPAPGEAHFFGPTGIYADMYADHLVVTKLEAQSPSAGTLQAGDRIVAVNGAPLRGDIHKLFASCIDHAESEEGAGKLELQIEREARPATIALDLPVLGSYARSAPYTCAKTDVLITRAADALVGKGTYGRLQVGLLGLLATGEKRYIDHVGTVLRTSAWAGPDVALNMYASSVGWYYSYRLLILCEYYLLTGDDTVLPAIEKHAVAIAEGQDAAGLWNHRGANPAVNFGRLHGRLYHYGAINQTSVTLWLGLILAEKCGVEHPEVRQAIARTHTRYRSWIGKGALPYGNHQPMQKTLNNNGTSGSVAIGFSLLGDMDGARFYSMLSTASHSTVLTGHSTPFFNILWSGLGANVAGPEAAAAYFKRVRWLRTVTRTASGEFLSQGRTSIGRRDLGSTGSALLNLCLGRRALSITGKEAVPSIWIDRAEADAIAHQGDEDLFTLDTNTLLARLGSNNPWTREYAAEALGERKADVGVQLVRMLRSGTRDERVGACSALAELKLSATVDPLLAAVIDRGQDLWVREKAAMALHAIGEPARKCVPGLLRVLVEDKPGDYFDDLDRRVGMLVASLAEDPYAMDLDRELFYRAVHRLLDHQHMWARHAGMSLIRNLPLEDFHRVADRLLYVIEDRDRTYTGYHYDKHRQQGLEILFRLGIRESIDLIINTTKESVGMGGPRIRGRVSLMKQFDANATYAIPRIREVLGKQADTIIEAIEASETKRAMISLAEARKAGVTE